MAIKTANARRINKSEPQLRVSGGFSESPPSKSDAANAYATIAARLGEDRSTLETTAWTPEREFILDMLCEELGRVPTDILIAWIPVICKHTKSAAGEPAERDALPAGCSLVCNGEA